MSKVLFTSIGGLGVIEFSLLITAKNYNHAVPVSMVHVMIMLFHIIKQEAACYSEKCMIQSQGGGGSLLTFSETCWFQYVVVFCSQNPDQPISVCTCNLFVYFFKGFCCLKNNPALWPKRGSQISSQIKQDGPCPETCS